MIPQMCLLPLLLFHGMSAGRTSKMQEEPSLSSTLLGKAAHATYANYNRDIQAGRGEGSGAEIPSKYWEEPIKALQPARVYLHRMNLVVVQRVRDNIEEGKYICLPISSYLPMSGDDGFEFTPNPLQDKDYRLHEVFDFKRQRANRPGIPRSFVGHQSAVRVLYGQSSRSDNESMDMLCPTTTSSRFS